MTNFNSTNNVAAASLLTGNTLASGVTASSLTSFGTQAQDLNMNSHKITNVTDPTSAQDSATKAYVDAVANGLSPKKSVNLATAGVLPTYTYNNGSSGVGATITGVATGVLTIDGVAVSLNDRILVKNETAGNAPYNGLYICTVAGAIGVAFVLTRTTDGDTSGELIGAYTYVEAGSSNATTTWAITNTSTITIGTTAITSTQISGPGTYTNGTGLNLIGNQFSIDSTVATLTGSQALTNKTYNGLTVTSSSGTLTITNGKTLSVSNTLTFAGTDGSTLNIGSGGTLGSAAFQNSASANTASTVVLRDSSGNFSAGTITAALTGNASTATALQTARAIYGNNFDGTAALTQVIASTYGGTGNGFTKFSGPASTEKTFTLPNASATLLYDGGGLGTPASGTLTNCTSLPVASIVGAASTTFSPGFTGFSSNPTYDARYQLIGKTCFIYLVATADGTSNATGFTITGLPFTKANNTPVIVGIGTDNGTQTSALGVVSGTTLTLYKGFQTGNAANWTNSGVKSFSGNFFYEIT